MKPTLTAIDIYLLREKTINKSYIENRYQYKKRKKSLNNKDKIEHKLTTILTLALEGNLIELQKIGNELREIDISLKNGVNTDYLIDG